MLNPLWLVRIFTSELLNEKLTPPLPVAISLLLRILFKNIDTLASNPSNNVLIFRESDMHQYF